MIASDMECKIHLFDAYCHNVDLFSHSDCINKICVYKPTVVLVIGLFFKPTNFTSFYAEIIKNLKQ